MIRVLHLAAIDPGAPGGGMERVIRDLVGWRGPRRSENSLFALRPDRGRADLGWIPAFLRAARAADIVHTHDLFGWLLGPAVLRAAGRPVVAHDHGAAWRAGPARRVIARATEACVARHVAVSEAGRRVLVARHGIAPERVRMIPNGRDPAELAPARPRAEIRAEIGAGEGCVVALAVARLVAGKGLEALVEAVAAPFRPGAPPGAGNAPPGGLVLAIAGDGPLRSVLEARAMAAAPCGAGRPAAGRVRFLGYRTDVGDLLAAADFFALPTRAESFGLAFVEAALAGLPAVGVRAPGVDEVVVHGETGLLVPPDDRAALAAAIGRLAGDADLRARLGAAARARALERYTLARVTSMLDAIYDEAAKGAGGVRRNG